MHESGNGYGFVFMLEVLSLYHHTSFCSKLCHFLLYQDSFAIPIDRGPPGGVLASLSSCFIPITHYSQHVRLRAHLKIPEVYSPDSNSTPNIAVANPAMSTVSVVEAKSGE